MSKNEESVDLVDDKVFIANLLVSDAIAIAHIQKHDASARADAVRNTIQLGARVLEYATDRLNAAEIAERIDASTETATKLLRSATATAKEALETQFGSTFGKNGRMEALLGAQLAALARDLEKHLDPQTTSSVLGKFTTQMRAGWAENASSIVKLLDLDQPGSVSNRLASQIDAHHKTVSEQLAAIMREMAVRSGLRAERVRGTAKGTLFEDQLEHALGAWAVLRHDRVVRCALEKGALHNSRAGDFIVEISPREAGGAGLKIAIEARNSSTGATQARRDLERATENRGATVGVYVTTDRSAIPKGAPPVYFLDLDRVFVAVEYDPEDGLDSTLLEVALEVARARALTSRTEDPQVFDIAAVSAKVTEAINATARFTEIKRQLSGLGTGIERIKELVDQVRTDIRSALIALQDEVDRQASGGGERAA